MQQTNIQHVCRCFKRATYRLNSVQLEMFPLDVLRLKVFYITLEAIAIRLEAIATGLEAIVIRLEAIVRLVAIATRLEAIVIRLESIAIRLEAIVTRLEAIAIRLEAIAIRLLEGCSPSQKCFLFETVSTALGQEMHPGHKPGRFAEVGPEPWATEQNEERTRAEQIWYHCRSQ